MNMNKHSLYDDGRVVFRYVDLPQQAAPFEVAISCPLTSRMHADQETILEQHRAWARTFDLLPSSENYQRFCDTRFDLLIAYQLYDLPVESVVLASHLMAWFFVFDDVMDIDHGLEPGIREYRTMLCKRHLDMLNGERAAEDDACCIRAFSDFLQQVKRLSNGRASFWYERMKHHLREYVLGACWESHIGPTTAQNTNTALYLQIRHMSVGVAPCLDLMAIIMQIPPEPFQVNFFINRLERLAINYSIWINDLAGLGRDSKRGLGNVIFTLEKDHSLSRADAARMVGRMCDEELKAFFEVERQLPMLLGDAYAKDRGAYEAYVDLLKRWMRGLVDWSGRSARYQRLDVDMALQDDALIRRASQKDRSRQ
jgi:hypothetical protein